jgi:hypothetical protein
MTTITFGIMQRRIKQTVIDIEASLNSLKHVRFVDLTRDSDINIDRVKYKDKDDAMPIFINLEINQERNLASSLFYSFDGFF